MTNSFLVNSIINRFFSEPVRPTRTDPLIVTSHPSFRPDARDFMKTEGFELPVVAIVLNVLGLVTIQGCGPVLFLGQPSHLRSPRSVPRGLD